MDQGVDAAIEQRQENVQPPLRLDDQLRPNLPLRELADDAVLVAVPDGAASRQC